MHVNLETSIRLKYENLSPGQKKTAEYLMQNLEYAALNTAAEIGRQADVSETTVIRLSYALGFSGFAEMQELLRHQLLKTSSGADSIPQKEKSSDPFREVIDNEMAVLKKLVDIDRVALGRVVDELVACDRVVVVGFRASYALAYWFSWVLGLLRSSVELISSNGDVYEKILTLTDQSVLFAVSFPRYTKETVQIAQMAKDRGVKVISVTDRFLSPVGRISDLTLTTSANELLGIYSSSSVMSLLNLIVTGVFQRDELNIRSRLEDLEKFYSKNGVFIE